MERVRNTTKQNYYSVWKTFNDFFIKLDVKPKCWEDRILLFVEYLIENGKQSQTVRSYISAIKNVIQGDGVEINENRFAINALTRACKLKKDRIILRLPIKKGMVSMILSRTRNYFETQPYLAMLYSALF